MATATANTPATGRGLSHGPPPGRLLTRWYLANERLVLGVLGVLLFLGAWETVSRLKLGNAVLLSSPTAVVTAAVRMYTSAGFLDNLAVSAQEYAIGYGIAAVTGLLLGLAVGWYPTVSAIVEPYIMGLYSIPKAALLPLFLIWLGIGVEAKIAMVFLWSIFPVVINTTAGVRALEGEYIRLARSFQASDSFLFRTVVLPGTIPFILTGLRLSVARGLVGLVISELYGANSGIGFLITYNGAQFRIPEMLAGVLVIVAFGVGGTQVLYRIERAFDRWRPAVGA